MGGFVVPTEQLYASLRDREVGRLVIHREKPAHASSRPIKPTE